MGTTSGTVYEWALKAQQLGNIFHAHKAPIVSLAVQDKMVGEVNLLHGERHGSSAHLHGCNK